MHRNVLKQIAYFFLYGALGALAAVATLYALHLQGLPGLKVWHTAHLDEEFRAQDAASVRSIAEYRALEDRLFRQLRQRVYERVTEADRHRFNRYFSGSRSSPQQQAVDWNRTFELVAPDPRGGVLLLHGLSDSPYTVRAIAELLHARGYHVVGLRLPGHGTAPSALMRVSWKDMAAAVRLAARDLARRVGPDKSLDIVGYSTGAALAVEYSLARLQGEELPPVRKLVLISPAIGVSPAAALAVWQGRLAVLLGIPKLAWTDVMPEYDPYKYSSFPVNAGDQVYAITQVIAGRLAALGNAGAVSGLPRILAFQSVADATVSTPAVVDSFFRRLAPGGHELVLFDINRHADAEALYLPGIPEVSTDLLRGPALPFDLSVLANAGPDTDSVVVRRRSAGTDVQRVEPNAMSWAPEVFSLSHVALPFDSRDPVYGAERPEKSTLIYLGRPELRGERGLLAVSPATLMRLRHNPFFDYMRARIETFLDE